VTGEQIDFGSQLRRERERRKISLASVAESTKISKSLLASLESGDASQWPGGIYRRAFLREYAAAVGLPSESILAEFQRLFPEPGRASANRFPIPNTGGDLRLTLAPERRWSVRSPAIQVAAAFLDGAAILAAGAATAALLQQSMWMMTGLLALIYHTIATAWLGGSASLSMMNATLQRGTTVAEARSRPRPQSRELLHIVSSASRPDVQDLQQEREAAPFVENARSAS
jgi:transcriptional regulator with XRE-family HTH domain